MTSWADRRTDQPSHDAQFSRGLFGYVASYRGRLKLHTHPQVQLMSWLLPKPFNLSARSKDVGNSLRLALTLSVVSYSINWFTSVRINCYRTSNFALEAYCLGHLLVSLNSGSSGPSATNVQHEDELKDAKRQSSRLPSVSWLALNAKQKKSWLTITAEDTRSDAAQKLGTHFLFSHISFCNNKNPWCPMKRLYEM